MRKPAAAYWSVYVVSVGIWSSGVLWLLFHYFVVRQTEFGRAPHPLEHWWLVLHGAFAFATLWLLGFLWGTHIQKRWKLRRHRKTGGVLFGVLLFLVASGYFLYYLSSDDWRATTSVAHWMAGVVMPLALIAHWLIRGR